jgi:hypothetical protein
MTGAGLWNFVIALVGLAIVIALIFAAMEFRSLPEPYKRFARLAVGGAALLLLLAAIGSVLFGTSSGIQLHVSAGAIIEFAIGVIILYAVLFICDWAIDFFSAPYGDGIKFILTIIALVVILGLAERALVGGGLGFIKIGEIGKRSEMSIDKRVGLQPDGGISYIDR